MCRPSANNLIRNHLNTEDGEEAVVAESYLNWASPGGRVRDYQLT